MEFESFEQVTFASAARIKVVGVGGGGGNAVQNMIDSALRGVNFICANTDVQALNRSTASCKLQMGERLTKGLGAGANPCIGRDAALESVDTIKECLTDADMVFVTAGMGGGTGTGAAPIIAQIAKELGALTVGVVTKPFSFEGARRKAAAETGIAEFRQHVDCLITIPNDRLLTFAPKKAPFSEMLKKANDILYCAVKGISDVIMEDGLINLDFADVRAAMGESGLALMGTGIASGENRAREAAMRAITSPLLEDVSIDGARAVLYNITASMDITGDEIQEIGTIIADAVHPDASVFFGVVYDEHAGDELRITVIATGIDAAPKAGAVPSSAPGTVTPFPSGGKYSPAQPQRAQPAPASQNAAQAGGGAYRPRRVVDGWPDEKSDKAAYVRKGQALGYLKAHPHAPGEEDFIFDEEEFEMPAFIRRQAD
ncbi:MAG: cell division protein FtsZ [Deltaproteobacteria bacterium]|jgi:cell division protein FtsZ|nr:cell division protein FtsZ [Deltaproteobacteria bacterium]